MILIEQPLADRTDPAYLDLVRKSLIVSVAAVCALLAVLAGIVLANTGSTSNPTGADSCGGRGHAVWAPSKRAGVIVHAWARKSVEWRVRTNGARPGSIWQHRSELIPGAGGGPGSTFEIADETLAPADIVEIDVAADGRDWCRAEYVDEIYPTAPTS